MQRSILGLSLAFGVAIFSFSQAALAQQTTTRTGPYGNTQTIICDCPRSLEPIVAEYLQSQHLAAAFPGWILSTHLSH
jgi:hypothetical protein